MRSVLQQQEPQFLRRNSFIHACLGLLALAKGCEALVVSGAAAAPAGMRDAAVEGDDAVVFALLGALRLAREFQERLAGIAPPPARRAAPSPSTCMPLLRELAR